jgi:DNA-binding HxlR family transcriptional regulator
MSTDPKALQELLRHVGDKWSLLAVEQLAIKKHRFSELKRAVPGVSQRMLTLTLRSMERLGLVWRTVFEDMPQRVEYELTPLGRSLVAPSKGLVQWAWDHVGTVARKT